MCSRVNTKHDHPGGTWPGRAGFEDLLVKALAKSQDGFSKCRGTAKLTALRIQLIDGSRFSPAVPILVY